MKFDFIQSHSSIYPVVTMCRVMRVSRSTFYDWRSRPAKVIDAATLHLCRRMKVLFAASRNSLGSREMMKKLREEGFDIGRERVRKLMKQLKL